MQCDDVHKKLKAKGKTAARPRSVLLEANRSMMVHDRERSRQA